MASRFDPDFNAEIRRVVKNFNQKRNRAYRKGFSYLPNRQYVSYIKQNLGTKSEIEKYLNTLKKFNNMGDSALDIIETRMGGRISRYNLMFLKENLEDTKDFFDRQIEEAKNLFYEDQYSIARRDYLFNLQQKRAYLNKDIMDLNQSGIRTFEKYTRQALNNNRNMLASYKGFLSAVDIAMRQAGYDEKTISNFYSKLGDLTPAQFVKMYRSSDLIARVYELIDSPTHGKAEMNLKADDARLLLDKLVKDFDVMKKEAIDKTDDKPIEVEDQTPLDITKTKEGKLKKSMMTPKQYEDLIALGWDDLVDENE